MEKNMNLILVGSILLFFMIKWLIIAIKMKKYIKVKGKVISSKKDYIVTADGVTKGAHNKYYFEYLDKEYNIEDEFYGGDPKLNVGDDVYIYISLKNPDKYLTPENIYCKKIYFIGMFFSILVLFIILVD